MRKIISRIYTSMKSSLVCRILLNFYLALIFGSCIGVYHELLGLVFTILWILIYFIFIELRFRFF